MADIQNITIVSTQTDPQPKPHTSYTVQISTPTRTWTVNRRYNDFVALHAELKSSTGKEPPSPLPAKSWGLGRTVNDDKKIRERKIHLETYLRTILTTKDARWRTAFGFGDFLGVPSTSKQSASSASGPSQWTPSTWLAEHADVLALLRNARSALLKRDALAAMADASGSRGASGDAKRALRDLSGRIMALEKGLAVTAAALGDGERRRREDMLESIKVEQAALLRTAEAGVRTAQATQSSSAPSSAFTSSPSHSMPGAFHATAPSGRVFGRRAEPQETEQTRPLDDRGLLQLQQEQMTNQDAQLTELSKLLRTQRVMGEEIAQEVAEQNEMLDDVDANVTRVGGKLARAKRELNRLG